MPGWLTIVMNIDEALQRRRTGVVPPKTESSLPVSTPDYLAQSMAWGRLSRASIVLLPLCTCTVLRLLPLRLQFSRRSTERMARKVILCRNGRLQSAVRLRVCLTSTMTLFSTP